MIYIVEESITSGLDAWSVYRADDDGEVLSYTGNLMGRWTDKETAEEVASMLTLAAPYEV